MPRFIPPGRELPRPVPAERRPSMAQDAEGTVTLRYRSHSGVVVQGPATGSRYQFRAGASMQTVSRRDAEALIATGMFERI